MSITAVGWRAWLHVWPMSAGTASYEPAGYPATYGPVYPGTAGGITIPIDQGSLAGAETQRPRYQLRLTTRQLDAATLDMLDPTAGVWVDLWVSYDFTTPRVERRARLVLTHAHTVESALGQAHTDIEAVSVDALTVGEAPLYHRLPGGMDVMGWLSWAWDQGYLYNRYDAVAWGTSYGFPQGWAPERGQTMEQIFDQLTTPGRVWFGNLEGQLDFRDHPNTTAPHFGVRNLTTDYAPVVSWEVRRSWDQWFNAAVIWHTRPDGSEVTWRVTHGRKDARTLWRFFETDSRDAGAASVVAEQLARTSARADTITLTVAASGASLDVDVSDTARANRSGQVERLWIVQGMSLDLASGQLRATLRGDIVRLARFNAVGGMGIAAQDYVTIDDAEQIIGGRLVPLEENA